MCEVVKCRVCSEVMLRKNLRRHLTRCHSVATGPREILSGSVSSSVLDLAVIGLLRRADFATMTFDSATVLLRGSCPEYSHREIRCAVAGAVSAMRVVSDDFAAYVHGCSSSDLVLQTDASRALSQMICWQSSPLVSSMPPLRRLPPTCTVTSDAANVGGAAQSDVGNSSSDMIRETTCPTKDPPAALSAAMIAQMSQFETSGAESTGDGDTIFVFDLGGVGSDVPTTSSSAGPWNVAQSVIVSSSPVSAPVMDVDALVSEVVAAEPGSPDLVLLAPSDELTTRSPVASSRSASGNAPARMSPPRRGTTRDGLPSPAVVPPNVHRGRREVDRGSYRSHERHSRRDRERRDCPYPKRRR